MPFNCLKGAKNSVLSESKKCNVLVVWDLQSELIIKKIKSFIVSKSVVFILLS